MFEFIFLVIVKLLGTALLGIRFDKVDYEADELMEFSEVRTEKIPVLLSNGMTIKIEMAEVGREDVAFDVKPFKQVTDALEGIIEAIALSLEKAKPNKASVKFGVEVAIESGALTASIVKGASKANLEITLEWSR